MDKTPELLAGQESGTDVSTIATVLGLIAKYGPYLWRWITMYWRGMACTQRERKTFPSFIYLVEVSVNRSRLNAPSPRLSVDFYFLNASVYDIELGSVSGRFRYQADELSGKIELEPHREQTVAKRGKILGFTVTQWISREEAEELVKQSLSGDLHLLMPNVSVDAMIHSPWKTGKKHRLKTPDSLWIRTKEGWKVEHIINHLIRDNMEDNPVTSPH